MTMTQERMNTVGNDETFSDDIRALRKERAKIKNRRDDIVIFPNGDKWFVFDDDANRLFEVLGWQTSEKLMDEGAISWMNLSDEGREALLLTDLNPISLWIHAEINVAGWSSEEDYKADRLSLAQQTLDYLLQFNRNATRKTGTLTPSRMSALWISKDTEPLICSRRAARPSIWCMARNGT